MQSEYKEKQEDSWDTNEIARQVEASSLPPSPSVQC